MSNTKIFSTIFVAFTLLTAPIAEAHSLFNGQASWLLGFLHPLLGIDHILALLAVGLWAAQQGGSRLWQLPIVFLVVMAFGAYIGFQGFVLPMVETGIVSSLLLLGMMLVLATRFSMPSSFLIISFFALFHGYDHTMSIAADAAYIDYASGFLMTTSVLLFIGIALGFWARVMHFDNLLRAGGLVISFTGGWLCI